MNAKAPDRKGHGWAREARQGGPAADSMIGQPLVPQGKQGERHRGLLLVAVLAGAAVVVLVLAGCVRPQVARPSTPALPLTSLPATVLPATLPPTASSAGFPCPQPTPEYLAVEPVTSPTGELSQVVTVSMGNMEVTTITAESGVFAAADGRVEVALLPNTVHHLAVAARVRQVIDAQGCTYGGYTLLATLDRAGAPLVIVQGQPGTPRPAAEAITPDNATRLEVLASFSPEGGQVTDFAFLGSDELLSVGYGTAGGIVYGWSLGSGQQARVIGAGQGEALAVAASPDGSLIATGGTATGPAVRLWDVRTGVARELGRHDAYLESVAFSPSGALLASGGNDNTVRVWQVDGGQLTAMLRGDVPGHSQAFHTLYWAGDQVLVSAGSNAIYWWDVTTGRMARRIDAPPGVQFLVGAALVERGERIAAVAQDSRLYVWDGQWSALPVQSGVVLADVAFSPDGRLVAAGTYDGTFYMWDAASGKLLTGRSPAGPAGGTALRFSPDGRYFVSGGWQAPIRLWGVP